MYLFMHICVGSNKFIHKCIYPMNIPAYFSFRVNSHIRSFFLILLVQCQKYRSACFIVSYIVLVQTHNELSGQLSSTLLLSMLIVSSSSQLTFLFT